MKFDGHEILDFSSGEFPEDVRKFAHVGLIIRMQEARDALGEAINPSMRPGALARFGSESVNTLHSARGRLSTALDWFTDADPLRTWYTCVSSGRWDGVGIYFDTRNNSGRPAVMFHTDYGRPRPALWLRIDGEYIGSRSAGHRFWRVLREQLAAWTDRRAMPRGAGGGA